MKNPLINGIAFSFAEIVVDIDGDVYTAFKSINYKNTIERGKVRGNSMRKLAVTSGQIDSDADIEMALDDYKALVAKFGDGFMRRRFDVKVSYSNDDGINADTIVVYTDWLKGCQMGGAEHSNSQGVDGITVKVPLSVMQILEGTADGLFLDPIGESTV